MFPKISESILKNIHLFQKLSPDELSSLTKIIRSRHYAKHQVILREEDTPYYMYIVFSGRVKAVTFGEDGHEHIMAFHKRGGYFGEMSLLDGKTSPATIVALDESHIGLISKENFEEVMLKNQEIYRQVIVMLCSRLRESWHMLKVLRHTSAEQRVRGVLEHFGYLHGVTDVRGTIIPLKLTHKSIAEYASVSRETVTRLMKRLVQANEITFLDNRQIILNSVFLKNN